MTTVFTRIIEGELPAHVVYRDDTAIVFLSIDPIAPGHALVVPVREVDHWTDLTDVELTGLTSLARRLGRAQRIVFGTTRVGLMIAGFEVPHCHIHVVPSNTMRDLDFANARRAEDHDALANQARRLAAAMAGV